MLNDWNNERVSPGLYPSHHTYCAHRSQINISWVRPFTWFYFPQRTYIKEKVYHSCPSLIKNICLGLPWWRSGWESACQCRRHGFEPSSGKIPHAVEQVGPWATIAEPARLEPVLCNKRGRDSERPAHRDEEWPPLAATRESPGTET